MAAYPIPDPIKPYFPPIVDEATGDPTWQPFLASIPLPDVVLKSCCITKAIVTSLYSHDKVNIDTEYDDPNNPGFTIQASFTGVRLWAHTDIGTRGAYLADVQKEFAYEYFKNAAYRFPFLGKEADDTQIKVGVLLYQPPPTPEEPTIYPPKEALGICCVFTGFFSLYSGMVFKDVNVIQYIYNSSELYEYARPTYHPYLRITLGIYMTYGIDNSWGLIRFLVNMETGQIASFPTYYIEPDDPNQLPTPLEIKLHDNGAMYEWYDEYYTQGIPMAPMRIGAHYTMDDQLHTLTHMNAFLNRAIRVKSEDCWLGYSESYSGEPLASGIFSLDFNYIYDYNSLGQQVLELGPDDPAWGFWYDSMNYEMSFRDRDSTAYYSFSKVLNTLATEENPNGQATFVFNGPFIQGVVFDYKWHNNTTSGVTGMSRLKVQFTKNNLYDVTSIGAIHTEYVFGAGDDNLERCLNGHMEKCEARVVEFQNNSYGPTDPEDPDFTTRYTLKDALEAVFPYAIGFYSNSVNWRTTRMRLLQTDLFLVPYDPRIDAIL